MMDLSFPFYEDLKRGYVTFVPQGPHPQYIGEDEARRAANFQEMAARHPDVQVESWFGRYTFAMPAEVTSSGTPYVEHENHPVWLIRFANYTEHRPGRGGSHSVTTEQWVVIDAMTAESLRRWSFR